MSRSASEPLTFQQAADELRWRGPDRARRLKRLLLAREKQRKREIMTRIPGRRRTHYRVTMAALKRWCPDLFESKADQFARDFQRYLKSIDEQIELQVVEQIESRVLPEVERLDRADSVLEQAIRELAGRVKKLASARPRKAAHGRG